MRTTTRQFDFVNRLTQIASVNNQPSTINQSTYAYDPANQRTSRTEADNSFWLYSYDLLGQATAAKRYWSDGVPVTGQQFEYIFDWIGNRLSTSTGGDEMGAALRAAAYAASTLNQYTQRTVPSWVSILGETSSNTTVRACQ